MRKLSFLILLTSLIFISCKKNGGGSTYTIDERARDSLYSTMKIGYLWNDSMPTVVKDNYSDPYSLLNAMMYKKRDKWSFVDTYSEYLALTTGSFVGHGIRLGLDPDNQVRIVSIYSRSDLYNKGVRRGWIVKTLNGTALAPIFITGNSTAYSNLIGPATAGITNTFVFQTPAGKDSTLQSTKASFTVNPVLIADTLHLSSGVAGHFVLDQFFDPAPVELDSAFALFQRSNVNSLIIDLRYNGGGDLDLLTSLASMIAGSQHAGSNFVTLKYNNLLSMYNENFLFANKTHNVTVSKIAYITTRATASASEDLINGLKPFMTGNFVTLGDTTDGKPVGMLVIPFGTYYMFWPIMFKVVNSSGSGDFYAGIAPDKIVDDDITHDFSDRNESCLKEAIYYLEHGSLSSKGAYIYRPSVQFDERPGRFSNLFVKRDIRNLLK
ncbi:MAG TPA: S41 family peptidase [Bacteroidales bacterium]|nr:S41 family peptidase [Bacteroidales bacterium]